MTAKSDFGRAVADEFRGIREVVESRPINTHRDGEEQFKDGIDRSVKEQVISDIDRVIEHHENRKPLPAVVGAARDCSSRSQAPTENVAQRDSDSDKVGSLQAGPGEARQEAEGKTKFAEIKAQVYNSLNFRSQA